MGNSIKRTVISVFGSSRPREGEPEYAEARALGTALARAGFVICNGGYGGIMEATARGAKEVGGETLGVTVQSFSRTPNRWLDIEISRTTLVERLSELVDKGDGYVILKGGTGTLLELAYVWEFINKRLMREKPILILGDFWSKVVETLNEELLWEGMGDCTRFVRRVDSPEECADVLKKLLP
jgi:hypothetical protein